jgi:two-component sensor histidine kinase
MRAASAAVSSLPLDSPVCRATLQRLLTTQPARGAYALYGEDGRLRCATPGYQPPPVLADPGGARWQISLSPSGDLLRFALFDERGNAEGIGEYSRAAVAQLAAVSGKSERFDLDLIQGNRLMPLRDGYEGGALVRTIVRAQPIASGRLQLRITTGAVPITFAELLMILLPVMMWVAAAIIGWLIVDRLLLRPLVRMQKAVAAYQPGDRQLDLPSLSTPAREIGALGEAFDEVTRTVARHEADLEAAVERQTRLVREVHHRVKNNLQVVASLLNLHSRGSRNEEVAAAYASIQRRVDALAVVHRNHFAELEENRGVALRSLISELAANLRGTAPASAANMQVSLDIEPFYATQDVAVPIAFLITELVEFAMFCRSAAVRIALNADGPGSAILSVESDNLRTDYPCDPALYERFDRIVTGLSRQLRSSITKDEAGRYSLAISVIDKAER